MITSKDKIETEKSMLETTRNTIKTEEVKQTGGNKGIKPRWKKGESGNPKGRKKGTKNFMTYFDEAAKEVAEALKLGKEPDKVKVEIFKRGIKEALKGNFNFYEHTVERLFGKVQDNIKLDFPENLIDLIKNVTDKTQR